MPVYRKNKADFGGFSDRSTMLPMLYCFNARPQTPPSLATGKKELEDSRHQRGTATETIALDQ